MKHACECCGVEKHSREFTRIRSVALDAPTVLEYDYRACRSCKTAARESGDSVARYVPYRVCGECNERKHYRGFHKGERKCIACEGGIKHSPERYVSQALRRFACGHVNP